ncbi:MAG: Mrp/NBP35 family ATP-binding protein [Bacteroidota bacterium]|nr:Mrp/NBP35 family ATP-binding protein [Bacteroidota bacterium]
MTRKAVLQALSSVIHPDRGHDIARLGLVRDLAVTSEEVTFTLHAGAPGSRLALEGAALCTKAVKAAFDDNIRVSVKVVAKGSAGQSVPLGVQHMIAVASGKGGVGKSTVAVNLAAALARQGYQVGLVDTDIYGPSVPVMMGTGTDRPRVNRARKIIPLQKHGVHLLSMGFLVDDSQAVIWRGPMVSSAVKQFLNDAEWGELDFLILDLPPGTGDIQLTIVQTVKLAGAVVVSTPQRVALADARKGVAMFEKVNVPVLGIIENMAWFTPPDMQDRKYYLFGQGGAKALAAEVGVPLLAEIPLEQQVREAGDDGTPVVLGRPYSASAMAFRQATDRMVAALSGFSSDLPVAPVIEYR